MNPTTPPGWYDDGTGAQRWWDGQRWTEHRGPAAQQFPSYPGGVPAPHVGHPASQAAWQHGAPPAPRRTTKIVLIALGAVAVVCIAGFVLFTVFSGGSTHTQWYQEGYDVGSKATSLARLGSTPEAACDLALIGKIKYDDSPYSTRVKELRRGCVQAVLDSTEK